MKLSLAVYPMAYPSKGHHPWNTANICGRFYCLARFSRAAFGARAEEPVATGTNGDRIDLYDEQGSICPEGLKRAVYVYLAPHPRAGETVEGCWRADSMRVFMAFADGDRGALDLDVFTWRRSHTGQRL